MTQATDLTDLAFTRLGPKYTEPRPIQTQLLRQLVEDRPKLAMVEAPTGIGKSAMALAYGELIDSKITTVLTATISLQEQYERDFSDMVVFKGRGNYECENGLSAAEGVCMSRPGYRCDSDYYVMRREVEQARRVAANYAVYLNHLFHSRLDRKPDLLVCDEGHRLLDILTQFETVKLDAGLVNKLKVQPRGACYGWFTLEEAQEWAYDSKSDVQAKMQDAIVNGDKKAKLWAQLHRQIQAMDDVPEDYITLRTGEVLEAAPLWPRKAAAALFRSAHHILIQSATLYGGHTLADLLGLNPIVGGVSNPSMAYNFYTVPSPFNSARWPTYFRPVVSLSKRSTDAEWARMAEVVHDYMHRYSSVKGVIHVAARNQVDRLSTRIRECRDGCRDRLLLPSKSQLPGGRARLLDRFRRSPPGTWICHYSVGEGESFDDDTARIQLIAKVPYPDLGDKLTRLRSEEPGVGRRMYAAMTLAKIAQTSGRVMRHSKDYGETVILDGSFSRLWKWHKDLAPDWFHDVLVF